MLLLATAAGGADDPPKPPAAPEPKPEAVTVSPDPAPASAEPSQRVELNLLGKTDTATGESRRNENIQFNLIDNNALKELNVRMGTTATIVEEFRPERGYFGVEFGNSPPASLHVGPARARSRHGSLYESHSNSVFSARSFFQVGGVKPAHDNDYGFTFGSPLWRGATFSLDGSQQKIRGSVNGNILVPKAGERTPLTTDAATRAIVARFLAAYPAELPNRTDIDPRALNTNSPQLINTDNTAGRFDQILADRDRLSLRYAFTAQRVDAFQLLAGQNPDTHTRSHLGRLTWNRVWSPETVTDISAGYDRLRNILVPEPHAVGPNVTFGNIISDLGPTSSIPINRTQNLFRYAAQIRQVRGRHAFTAGFDLLRRQLNGSESSSHNGTLQFRSDFGHDAITNLRLGLPSRFSYGYGNTHRGFRNWDMQYYAGDAWRARPSLTLSYGLHYRPITAPYEVNNLSFIPYSCDCNNVAPRFGIAYRAPGHWGTLRANYGLQYGEIFPVTFQQARFNPPNGLKFEIQVPNLVNPLAGADLSPTARNTFLVIEPNLVAPYSHQYNFSWEPFNLSNWKLQIGYVGSRSIKLLEMWHTNRARPTPGIDQITDTVNLRRPDSAHYEVRRILNGSIGYFDAARVAVGVPGWHGLSLDAAYWFSKAIDLGGSYTNVASGEEGGQSRAQSEFLIHQDQKGPSNFDQSHAFLWRVSYAAPTLPQIDRRLRAALGNWSLSAVLLLKSGMPFTVTSGSDGPGFGNVDGSGNDRPNLVDPRILGRTIGDPDTSRQLLPRSAFTYINPTDLRGNLGHNNFRRGGIHNVNAALSRTWPIGSERTLTFRAESINFFNTPQFDVPSHDLTAPSFGQITNTLNDGRTFRFLLRFAF